MPTLTRVFLDHAGMITTVAVIISVLGITVLELSRRRAVRIIISIVTSLILFGLVSWDFVAFWLVYVATLKGLS